LMVITFDIDTRQCFSLRYSMQARPQNYKWLLYLSSMSPI
jgi:hypothetical protein